MPQKLGFKLDGRLRARLEPKEDGGPRRDSLLFSLLASEVAGSPCAAYEYAAYDALGREL